MKKVAFLLKSLDETHQEFDMDTVKLCIEILERRFMGDLNREDMEVRRCIEDLKKYFGVES
jgi:hypothetical protein